MLSCCNTVRVGEKQGTPRHSKPRLPIVRATQHRASPVSLRSPYAELAEGFVLSFRCGSVFVRLTFASWSFFWETVPAQSMLWAGLQVGGGTINGQFAQDSVAWLALSPRVCSRVCAGMGRSSFCNVSCGCECMHLCS